MDKVVWRVWSISKSWSVIENQAGAGVGEAPGWRTGAEPREILLDPMVAGSRSAGGCEFDLAVDREGSPRVERIEMAGLVGVSLYRIVRL